MKVHYILILAIYAAASYSAYKFHLIMSIIIYYTGLI